MNEEHRREIAAAAVEHAQVTAQLVERAMSNAIRQAINDGVPMTDTEEMRKRILEAREAVLQNRA